MSEIDTQKMRKMKKTFIFLFIEDKRNNVLLQGSKGIR